MASNHRQEQGGPAALAMEARLIQRIGHLFEACPRHPDSLARPRQQSSNPIASKNSLFQRSVDDGPPGSSPVPTSTDNVRCRKRPRVPSCRALRQDSAKTRRAQRAAGGKPVLNGLTVCANSYATCLVLPAPIRKVFPHDFGPICDSPRLAASATCLRRSSSRALRSSSLSSMHFGQDTPSR